MNELMETGTGPALPPIGDSYDTPTPKEDTSFLDRLQEETKDFLDKKHPALGPIQSALEIFGPLGAAADVKDAYDFTKDAFGSAIEGDAAKTGLDLGYGAASLGAAFIPGLGGLGDVRRAVEDTSLFRQNPDKGISSTTVDVDNEMAVRRHNSDLKFYQEMVDRNRRDMEWYVTNDLGLPEGTVDRFYKEDERLKTLYPRGHDFEAPDYDMNQGSNYNDHFYEVFKDVFGVAPNKDIGRQIMSSFNNERRATEILEELKARPTPQKTIPKNFSNLNSFYNPIESAIATLPYSKRGTIDGQQATTWLSKKTPGVGTKLWNFFGLQLDPKKVYTRNELEELYNDRAFDIVGYRASEGYYADEQRLDDVIPDLPKELDYAELLIDTVPRGPNASLQGNSTHHTPQTIAHARVSIRERGEGQDGTSLLVEEIQSDAAQNPSGTFNYTDIDNTGQNSPFFDIEERLQTSGLVERAGENGFAEDMRYLESSNLVSNAQERTTQASVLQIISFGVEEGVKDIIFPAPEIIAAARGFTGDDIPKGFFQTYEVYLKKVLNNIQKELGSQISVYTDAGGTTFVDISNLNINPERTELKFNKGGLVPNMEDQTLEAFGEPEDPVSGNPVPPGGTPEGVRDDIDAKLSEGEYVLPAHVVRFIGVGKLEQLVQAVEQQLQKMEQGGRMGEPVQEPAASQDMDEELPFDPNELEAEEAPTGPMGFNQGGLVQDRVGNAPTVPNAPQTSVKLYRDRTGFIRAVPFVNGQAIGLVPEGAQEIPSGASPTGSNFQPTQQAQQSNQTGMGVSEFERNEKDNVSYDISSLSGQEARDMLRGQNQIVDFLDSPYGTAAKAVTGPFGRFAAAAQQPIQQALADQVLTQEYGEESQGLLGALLGGTKVGNVLGFDNRVQSLQDQDLVKEIRSNYTPPSSTRERVDAPTISRTTPSGRTVSSPVPTSRPDGLGGSSKSTPDSRDFGGDGGWSDAGQSVDNSRSSQGGFDGPGGLW